MAAATQSRRLIFWLVGAMLILSTALASAHSLPPHEEGVFPVAIQLYTLRNYGNIEQQLALAAAAGYQGVEFAGYHGLTAEEMKALLDKYNLLAISTHHGLTELESKLDDIIDYNLALGNTRIVVPSASANSGPEWRAIGERLNALGAKARELASPSVSTTTPAKLPKSMTAKWRWSGFLKAPTLRTSTYKLTSAGLMPAARISSNSSRSTKAAFSASTSKI